MKKDLHEKQIRHEELEAELRQTRKRQMEDVEAAQQRFESELKKHEEELSTVQESYAALQEKTKVNGFYTLLAFAIYSNSVQKSNEQLEGVIQERLVYEDVQRKKKEEELMVSGRQSMFFECRLDCLEKTERLHFKQSCMLHPSHMEKLQSIAEISETCCNFIAFCRNKKLELNQRLPRKLRNDKVKT